MGRTWKDRGSVESRINGEGTTEQPKYELDSEGATMGLSWVSNTRLIIVEIANQGESLKIMVVVVVVIEGARSRKDRKFMVVVVVGGVGR